MAKTDKTAVQEQSKVLKEQYEEVFNSDEAKIKIFDAVAENYFDVNFGTMRKSDFELLLFSIYHDQIIENMLEGLRSVSNENDRDVILKRFKDQSNDIAMARQLGLTPATIRSLKAKKSKRFANGKYNWRVLFKQMLDCARVDTETKKVEIPILDNSLLLELKEFLELEDGYIYETLNPNLLTISPEFFLRLLVEVEDETTKTKINERLRKYAKENQQKIDTLKGGIAISSLTWKCLKVGGKDIAEEIAKIYCPVIGPAAVRVVEDVLKVIGDTKKQDILQ